MLRWARLRCVLMDAGVSSYVFFFVLFGWLDGRRSHDPWQRFSWLMFREDSRQSGRGENRRVETACGSRRRTTDETGGWAD